MGMTTMTISANVRRLREERAWTQAQLAAACSVSERTIQRAEDGRSIGLETLQALAGAFNVSLDDLRRPIKSVTDPAQRFQIIPLTPLERASELRQFIPADALQLDYDGMTDEQEDAIAEFEQHLHDWTDIWRDLEPIQRRETIKQIQSAIDAIRRLEAVITIGIDVLRLRAANGAPFSMSVLHVIISKADEPKLFALRDKTAPVQFA